ncbi:hypothetical protein [Arthrobacter sp. ISL-65]|nr:hypothetical protein [Arthrobacter sp. ISL-65]MBT2547245.1 hypothetical protein [Arthrobacter sp. ISL-65]
MAAEAQYRDVGNDRPRHKAVIAVKNRARRLAASQRSELRPGDLDSD